MQSDFAETALPDSPLTSSARWIFELLTGPAATIVAIIAIALLGFALLQGRIDLRRGASVVIGIFIVFGAPAIAGALVAIAQPTALALPAAAVTPIIPDVGAAQSGNPQSAYDPYAGAALPASR